MKTTRNVLFALLLLGGAAGAASAATSVAADIHVGPSGRASVDLGFFYDDLASYGNWIDRPSYGWVWTPRAVSTSWRPYQAGHWVWTDEGWAWISDEPYGWATYHYGRWYDDPEIGWSWVPGDQWGPSWVSWQEGADYVGWAPLPPGVNVSVSLGSGYGGYAYGIAPEDYVFVPERNFLAPRIATYALPYDRVGPIFRQTRNFTNYQFNGGRVFNQGVPVDRIQRFAGRVPRYQVADLGYAAGKSWRQARVQGNRLAFFRPQVQKAARIAPPPNRAAARRAVIDAAQFKAAHPNRVAFAQRQGRQAQQQRAEVRGQGPALRQQQKAAQRQAQGNQRQARMDRTQQRQAQAFRQQQQKAAVQQRQARVDQRQTRVDRQQLRVDRSQQRQAQQAARQQRQAPQRQQRQAAQQNQRQQQRAAQQQQQRQAQRQQRANPNNGGPGNQAQGQGQGHRHGRPPGQ